MMEEKLLKISVKKGLRTDSTHNIWNYVVTMNQFIPHIDGYIEMILNIDNYPIKVKTYKNIIRGTMQYFHYDDGKGCFNNGQKISYSIYVLSDSVLDGEVFFTTTKSERRKLKIETIKNNLKK